MTYLAPCFVMSTAGLVQKERFFQHAEEREHFVEKGSRNGHGDRLVVEAHCVPSYPLYTGLTLGQCLLVTGHHPHDDSGIYDDKRDGPWGSAKHQVKLPLPHVPQIFWLNESSSKEKINSSMFTTVQIR